MEKKNAPFTLTEAEFLALLEKAQNNDPDAMLKLLRFFEPDMLSHSRYIQMPKEDALQSMRLAMIELFHQTPKSVTEKQSPFKTRPEKNEFRQCSGCNLALSNSL